MAEEELCPDEVIEASYGYDNWKRWRQETLSIAGVSEAEDFILLIEKRAQSKGCFLRYRPFCVRKHQISIGKEYLVLGISFEVNSPVYGNTAMLKIANDARRCCSIPAALFEIIDGRCSSFWEARFYEGGAVTLWPIQFYKPSR
jgi:hypothetical protein